MREGRDGNVERKKSGVGRDQEFDARIEELAIKGELIRSNRESVIRPQANIARNRNL